MLILTIFPIILLFLLNLSRCSDRMWQLWSYIDYDWLDKYSSFDSFLFVFIQFVTNSPKTCFAWLFLVCCPIANTYTRLSLGYHVYITSADKAINRHQLKRSRHVSRMSNDRLPQRAMFGVGSSPDMLSSHKATDCWSELC